MARIVVRGSLFKREGTFNREKAIFFPIKIGLSHYDGSIQW